MAIRPVFVRRAAFSSNVAGTTLSGTIDVTGSGDGNDKLIVFVAGSTETLSGVNNDRRISTVVFDPGGPDDAFLLRLRRFTADTGTGLSNNENHELFELDISSSGTKTITATWGASMDARFMEVYLLSNATAAFSANGFNERTNTLAQINSLALAQDNFVAACAVWPEGAGPLSLDGGNTLVEGENLSLDGGSGDGLEVITGFDERTASAGTLTNFASATTSAALVATAIVVTGVNDIPEAGGDPEAAGAGALGAVSGAGSGSVTALVASTGQGAIGEVGALGQGLVTPPAAASGQGALGGIGGAGAAVSLPVVSATGQAALSGLEGLGSGVAQAIVQASGSGEVGELAGSGSGSIVPIRAAAGAGALGGIGSSGLALTAEIFFASGAGDLGAASAVGIASTGSIPVATGQASLGDISASGSASFLPVVSAAGQAALGDAAGVGSAVSVPVVSAAGSAGLGQLTGAGLGTIPLGPAATGLADLGAVSGVGAGAVTNVNNAATSVDLGQMFGLGSASITQTVTADGDGDLGEIFGLGTSVLGLGFIRPSLDMADYIELNLNGEIDIITLNRIDEDD